MEKVLAFLVVALGGLLMIFGMALLFSIPTMLLWDWLMPTLFKLPEITLLQALGINFLSGILFGKSTVSNNEK